MLTTKIEKLNHEGRGIAHVNGKIVFVDGALPNEEVKITYTRRHGRFDEAKLEEIIVPSPFRVEPKCKHFDICGGCSLQHLHEDQQIALKQQTLEEHFQHFGHLQPQEWLPPLRGPIWHYRDKARISAKYVIKKQKLLLGFHEKSGRFVADLKYCDVLHEKAAQLLEPLRLLLSQLSIYTKIPQVEVAAGDNNTIAFTIRHLAAFTENDKNQLIQFAREHDVHIYLQPTKPEIMYCLWPKNSPGKLFYTLPEYELTLAFSPTQFTQINSVINQAMIKQAMHLLQLQPEDHVLDLFCGIGNFTLPLAKFCHEVVGVEGDAPAVAQAQENAKNNHINNATFHCKNLFEPEAHWSWIMKKYDKVLLDPPRTGAIEILPYIATWQPTRIVYVSCNPATLARDAGELVNKYGYTLVHAGVMDMFPHTRHVESMALFVKR